MAENIDIGADAAGDLNVQQQEEEVAAAAEHPANEGPEPEQVFLFEVYLIQGDDEMDVLLIPRELASDHFPPLLNRRYTYVEHIQITEPEGLSSDVEVGFLAVESAFVIANDWWKEYVNRNGLRPLDAILFSRHVPGAPKNHFLVDFIRRTNQQNMNVPEFRLQNLLFQLCFTHWANTVRLLSIPTEEVRQHFAAIGIPSESVGKARLHFTGARDNEWPVTMILAPTPTTVHHMMTFSDKFVTENNLKVGDLIDFYKPAWPLHSRHFLIKVAEGAGQMLEPGQGSGSAAKDSDGDNDGDGTGGGGNRKGNEKGISGRDKRQGDGGSSGGHPKRQKNRSFFVEGKGLWGYVDGSEIPPDASKAKDEAAKAAAIQAAAQWRVNNAKVVSWILGSVNTSIGIPMRGLRTAKEMWDYLEKVYQQSNLARKFQIEYDMFSFEQGEKTIQEFYASFMDLWAEYEFVNMGNMTTACCIQNLKTIYDERKVMQFLMKLRSDYENIRVQQKGGRNFDRKKSNHQAYHVTGVTTDGSNTDVKLGVASPTSLQNGAPFNDDIRKLVQSSVSSALSSAFSVIGLSGKNSHLSPIINPLWIIDPGASNHMTGIHTSPSSAKPYSGNTHIFTANGEKLDIVGTNNLSMSIIPNSSLRLPNVFLVPKLTTNLISVGQLVDDDNIVSFSRDGCLIQDRRTGMVKGKGRRIGRLATTAPKLLVYQRQRNQGQPTATSLHQPEQGQSSPFEPVSSPLPSSTLVELIPSEPVVSLRQSTRSTRPPDRLTLLTHRSLFTSLDSIDIPSSYQQNDPEDDEEGNDLGDFSLEGVELYSSPTEFTTAKMAERDPKGKRIADSDVQHEKKQEGTGEIVEEITLEGYSGKKKNRQESSTASDSADPLLAKPTQIGEKMGIFVFEMRLTQSNVEEDRLLILEEPAFEHFYPILKHRRALSMNLRLIDQKTSVVRLEAMDVIRCYKHVQPSEETDVLPSDETDVLVNFVKSRNQETMSSTPTQVSENMGIFLFEMRLTQRDFEQGRFVIPLDLILPYFPPLANAANRRNNYSRTIQVTDPENTHLNLLMRFGVSESALVHEGDLWKETFQMFKTEATDMTRFYRPVPMAHPYHFLVDFGRSTPEFKPENFLFQLELNHYGIAFRRLVVPTEEVRKHFPHVTRNEMIMRFTDIQNKSWLKKILFVSHTYMLVLEEDFVIDKNLKDGDVIRFYKPVRPLHTLHFLVELVSKAAASKTDPTQSRNPIKQGGGGGKHSGGRKVRKFPLGDCCAS
ncbi:hypothetical protein RHSIM_Rhsim02G0117000 [Rhododendron simsii]|uniref:Retrovirus-related Pol polyprotein from transposon TNT 1-94-like beta-barrel domain-containing protein n=1 Tax=Rhododendron simsii TaxID=118357 RepID=A0A834H990_RHOSS|nr:hypothetical protein RHSIM_Rhsim02G0117000 [Rhododendron simsii]